MIGIRLMLCLPVALVAATMHVLPWLSRRGRLFGRTVSEEFLESQGRALVRRYELRLLPWTVAAVAGWGLLPLNSNPGWRVALLMTMVAAAGWNVWRMFDRVPSASPGTGQVRNAELTTPDGGLRWVMLLMAVPAAALAGTAAYLHAHWAEIPERFPVHWNLQGEANRWSTRTVMDVYLPLMIGGGVLLLLAGITMLVRWGARRTTMRPAVMAILVVVSWMMGAEFTMAGLLPLHYFPPWQVLGVSFAGLGVIVATAVVAVRQTRKPGVSGEITPESCWKGGVFYYNPQDPALMVEKRIGVGWTFNFGHRLAWVILGLILLIPVGAAVILIAKAKR